MLGQYENLYRIFFFCLSAPLYALDGRNITEWAQHIIIYRYMITKTNSNKKKIYKIPLRSDKPFYLYVRKCVTLSFSLRTQCQRLIRLQCIVGLFFDSWCALIFFHFAPQPRKLIVVRPSWHIRFKFIATATNLSVVIPILRDEFHSFDTLNDWNGAISDFFFLN